MNFDILKKNKYYVDFLENKYEDIEEYTLGFPKNLIKNIEESWYFYKLDYYNSEIEFFKDGKLLNKVKAPNYSLFCIFYTDLLFKYSKHYMPLECSSAEFLNFLSVKIQDLLPEEKEMYDYLISLNKGKIPSVSKNIEEGANILTDLIIKQGEY